MNAKEMELNRKTVEEGLNRRKSRKQEEEQAHELMRQQMFELINANAEIAEELARIMGNEEALRKAQETSRQLKRNALHEISVKRHKGLQRMLTSVIVSACIATLYAFGEVRLWLAISALSITLAFIVVELALELKRFSATWAIYNPKEGEQ